MSEPMSVEEAIRSKLTADAGPVSYADLAAHLARDAVFVVAPSLSLVECGVAIAMDDVARVEGWAISQELRRPRASEREVWPRDRDRRWTALVIQPFVLVQEAAS